MYTTGETEQAVRLFLGLLKESTPIPIPTDAKYIQSPQEPIEASTDRTFLEDFRMAFEVRIRFQPSNYFRLNDKRFSLDPAFRHEAWSPIAFRRSKITLQVLETQVDSGTSP